MTGPTGEIGRSLMPALERSPKVKRILGMARRPFEPGEHGWKKTEYRQGDVLDRASVQELVSAADVVVHLAFIIFGGHEESRSVNLRGSRNVFEATAESGAGRLVYTSSVAAYGFDRETATILTEDMPAAGTEGFYYSAQKAELEQLLGDVVEGSGTEIYVFRPSIVAGPDALMFVEQLARRLQPGGRGGRLRKLMEAVPAVKPALPDNGLPIQLVHHDDVATALRAAVIGQGEPGVYNLAGDGTVTLRDVARELDWYRIPLPGAAVSATAELVKRAPFLPAELSWVNAMRVAALMDSSKAQRKLGWRPKFDAEETLAQTVAAARAKGLVS